MLFSEPSGGSDLGALRTVARRDGDHYVVKGHKIWTSLAHKAKVGVLVARTDSDQPKHKGLSQFLVDMDTPGIRIRPIIDMSAHENEYNEVFLEDVRIPADRLLGKEGEGWALCTTQLQTERVALSRPGAIWGHGPSARELVEGLAEVGALEDGAIRDEAAQIYRRRRDPAPAGLSRAQRPHERQGAGPEGAIHKMLAAPHGQRVVDLAKRSQGARGMIAGEKPFPSQLGDGDDPYDDWDYAFWFSQAVTLGVGTQEDPEERRRRTHARPAARSRSHRTASLGGSAAQAGLGERPMNFALSEDHLVLRQSARTFLEKEISLARVLVPGATVEDAGYAANWSKIAAMGWPGLVIDEAYDGLGLSCIDLAMILGEMGRTLAPSPFLGTLFGAWALQKGGSETQKKDLLPGVAAGSIKLALAVAEASGAVDGPCREASARKQGGSWRLTGAKSFVIDAAAADWLVVAAQEEQGRAFFLVDANQPGVQVDLLPWRDVTRQVADVRLKDAVGERLAADDADAVALAARPRAVRAGDGERRGCATRHGDDGRLCQGTHRLRQADRLLPGDQAFAGRHAGPGRVLQRGHPLRRLGPVGERCPRLAGRGDGQGLHQRRLHGRLAAQHPDLRRHRLHLGDDEPPLFQARPRQCRAVRQRPHAACTRHRHGREEGGLTMAT